MTVLSTDQLTRGDILEHHGMHVRLDSEPRVYTYAERTIYQFDGTVTNLEEVRSEGHVPMGYLRTHKWSKAASAWVVDREDVWIVQGNNLATWHVISR